MLGSRPVPVRFRRRFCWDGEQPALEDEIHLKKGLRFVSLAAGGEFFVRYVPQSRYFQSQELACLGRKLSQGELQDLNRSGAVRIRVTVTGTELNHEVIAGNG